MVLYGYSPMASPANSYLRAARVAEGVSDDARTRPQMKMVFCAGQLVSIKSSFCTMIT